MLFRAVERAYGEVATAVNLPRMSQQCIFSLSSLVSPTRPLAPDLPNREATCTVVIFDLSDNKTGSATNVVRVVTSMIPKGRILSPTPRGKISGRGFPFTCSVITATHIYTECMHVHWSRDDVCKQVIGMPQTSYQTLEITKYCSGAPYRVDFWNKLSLLTAEGHKSSWEETGNLPALYQTVPVAP